MTCGGLVLHFSHQRVIGYFEPILFYQERDGAQGGSQARPYQKQDGAAAGAASSAPAKRIKISARAVFGAARIN
jgi:hypothetical protein